MTSPDLTDANIDKLAELFPTVVTESVDADGNVRKAIDFDLLRQELSDHVVEGPQEHYQLDWPGKRAAAFAANAPIAKTLRPVREESVDFDSTKNLFIEGDNLDVLKMLQESYLGKVKLIFIDPPYNTGSDRFVYEDDFAEEAEEYLRRSGQVNDLGERVRSNIESSGRFHSDWLSMMYPRLKLARNLLAPNGVIFVSIGDAEAASLKHLLDETMGANNFVATVVWQKVYSPMNSATQFASVHDYIHVYARNAADWTSNLLPRTDAQDAAYKNLDSDPRGRWKAVDATAASGHATQSQFYELTTPAGNRFTPPPGRAWLYTEPRYQEMLADDRVWFGSDGNGRPAIKRFLTEVKQGRVAQTFWPYTEVGHTQDAKKELLARVAFSEGDTVFDTPKPTHLIRRMLALATSASSADVVLDFFGGSGTTADAVLQQNAEDGGARRFILVQLPDGGDDQKKGIPDVARERIRSAGRAVSDAAGLTGQGLDIGFRALRVDSSNMADVLRTPDDTAQLLLDELEASVKIDRTNEDLLFQVLLDWGLELTMSISVELVHENEVYVVEGGALIACFDDLVSAEAVLDIAKRQPIRAVFRDSGFESDAVRINTEQVFREVSPATDVKAI
ncbi:adenine-specific DNA-methyltransferase [Rhodoglobus vestalii]|uniref:Adenine-specific DNA-methyltransferase n=1 Tax=Rhodoglobus vestalii TaxID=193384 RepID=A0A8H2K8V3_9MICO|nr:site-specific DNA-methyltransferase [Rhodoglobus vestalii]TQO18856.1 adenine-specific DNA-methyltransferase [Rhodoglobus vestalii]